MTNARNLANLLGGSTTVPTAALPTNIQTLDVAEIPVSKLSLGSNVLTQSFDSNQSINFDLTDSVNASIPIVSAFKEVPQPGLTSKGQWDVNANATNYEFFDEKPISYSSVNLTPSATGDGTFTSSSMIIGPTDIDNLTYDNKSINITSLNHTGTGTYGDLRGFYIKPDGTKLFSLSTAGIVSEHVLSTAYDISTTTYNNVDTSALTTESSAAFDTNLALSPDGTKLFVLKSATKEIARYDLSTAWNLSTLSTTKHSYYIESANLNTPISFTFNADGTVLIIFYNSTDAIAKYDLSTAWDLSTASRASFTIVANSSSSTAYVGSTSGIDLHSLEFTNNGNVLLGSDYAQQKIYQWNLTSPYSITSTSLVYDTQFSITLLAGNNSSYGPGPLRVLNGKAYIVDGGTKSIIYQYTSSASNVFNAADVGKKVVGNSGSAIITATSGAYTSVTPFADTSTISSWTLNSAQGKADGTGIELSGTSQVGTPLNHGTYNSTSAGITYTGYYSLYSNGGVQYGSASHFGPDGTKFYSWTSSTNVRIWSPTTAFDISTLGNSVINVGGFSANGGQCIRFSKTGDKVFHLGSNGYSLHSYDLSTPYDLSTKGSVTTKTMSFQGTSSVDTMGWYQNNVTVGSGGQHMGNFVISPDGSYFVGECRTVNGALVRGVMSTPYDISTLVLNQSLARGVGITAPGTQSARNRSGSAPAWNQGGGIWFSDDGKLALWWGSAAVVEGFQYRFSTGWDFSTASGVYDGTTNNMGWSPPAPSGNSSRDVGTTAIEIGTKPDGQVIMQATMFWNNSALSPEQEVIVSYNLSADPNSSSIYPYSVYSPALTNSSNGQINSSSWQDINSMTADETKNGGDIFYAVSTDNRTSWSVAKGSDGVRKIARNNSGTWQYNNDGGTSSISGYDLDGTNSSAFSSFTSLSANSITAFNGAGFSDDGTKLYVFSHGDDTFYQFTLSTAWDETTASYASKSFTPASTNNWLVHSIRFNPDGTKMYAGGEGQARNTLYEYTLTTAWDISTANATATGDLPTRGVSGVTGECENIQISPNGSYVYALDFQSGTLHRWSLNTAWDLSSRTSNSPDQTTTAPYSWSQFCWGFDFSADGSKLYITNGNPVGIGEWDLSTSWSISGLSTSPDTSSTWIGGAYKNLIIGNSGLKLFGVDQSSGIGHKDMGNSVSIYGTTETWVNGTTNNEHATLQQALGAQPFNRMNKAQLDSVADGYHFSQDSADTLDLMIAPYAASGTSPISDGVTINYDAEAIVREAVNGTDYIAEFPQNNKVKIKSLIDANLKIRII